jgi:hypothetical protein
MILVLAEAATPKVAQAQDGTGDVAKKYLDAGGLSSEYIISRTNAAGFTDVYFVAFEHGLYSIKARHPVGHYVEIQLDPVSGALVQDPGTGKPRYQTVARGKPVQSILSWKDLVSQVKAAGYSEVYSIEYEHALYEIITMDAQNRVVELWANPNTGKLLRHPTSGELLFERVDY